MAIRRRGVRGILGPYVYLCEASATYNDTEVQSDTSPRPSDRDVSDWCDRVLGARPSEKLFEAGFASRVIGLRLTDDRKVVLKLRKFSPRLRGCAEVHRWLWERGFPCPQPLVEFHGAWMSAESHLPGGTPLVDDPLAPELYAAELAHLIELAPLVESVGNLIPPPAFADALRPNGKIWPDNDFDRLNADPEPQWLDEMAVRVQSRLGRYQAKSVVGHADWWSQNLRWEGRQLLCVDDWDSVTALPEAFLVGFAAYMFAKTAFEIAGSAPGANIEETQRFLKGYEATTTRHWSAEDMEVAWTAGLWIQLYDTKLTTHVEGSDAFVEYARGEMSERVKRADL